MKAIQVAEYGQVERLELIEFEELVPNDDQVLIDVAGSGIGKNFATRSDGRQLAEIAKLFAEKKLHAEVEVVSLSRAAEALMLSRGGHTRGKLVFDVNR